jgi:branched-chain amino acid transport system permease protein
LLAYQGAAFRPESYGVGESVTVFVAAVTGGLGTPLGAVIGALYLRGSQWLLPDRWQLLASAIGVLMVLLVIPEGLSALWFRGRDRVARLLAEREGIEEHRLGRRAEAPT